MFVFNILLYILVFVVTINLVYKIAKWSFAYYYRVKVINKIKGMTMLPFIGNAHQLRRRNEFFNQLIELSKRFKEDSLFRIWIGTHPLIVFHKPQNLEILLSGSKNIQKSFFYDFLHPWFGTGLLTSYGDKWLKRRRLVTPTFHFEILNDFLKVMNEQAEILTDMLESEIKKEPNRKILECNIFKRLGLCTLDIICETAMGRHVNAQSDSENDYVKAVTRISEIIFRRFLTPHYWYNFIFERTKIGKEHKKCLQTLIKFTYEVITEREKELIASNYNFDTQKKIAFLDILLKEKNQKNSINYEDIQEEVDTFMFEGHDTTSTAAGWACQLIGSHKTVQKKLHDEIDSIFGSSDRFITIEDLKKLKYLDLVLKETLRLFPSVPFFARVLSEDEIVESYKVLKGSTAVVLAYSIHRNEDYYPDAEKFNPDRFMPEISKNRHPYAYIPFSAGKRNCIGQRFAQMEEKVILASILRKFEIESLKTIEELKPVAELTLRPMNGIPIRLKMRDRI